MLIVIAVGQSISVDSVSLIGHNHWCFHFVVVLLFGGSFLLSVVSKDVEGVHCMLWNMQHQGTNNQNTQKTTKT